MKKVLTILFIVLLASCKATKTTTESFISIKRDTIYQSVEKRIYQSVHDTLTIENPCDSLRLKDFYYKSNIPQGKVIIRSLNGNITATINMDSIESVISSKYKGQLSKDISTKYKEIVKYKIPFWIFVVIFFESLLIIVYIYFKFIKL